MFGSGYETQNQSTGLTLNIDKGWTLTEFSKKESTLGGEQFVIKLTKSTKTGKEISKIQWVNIPPFEIDEEDKQDELLKNQHKFVNYCQNYVRGFNLVVTGATFEEYINLFLEKMNENLNKEVDVLFIPPLKWNNSLKKWQLKINDKNPNKLLYLEIPKLSSTQNNFIRLAGNEKLDITISKNLQDTYKEMLEYNQNIEDMKTEDSSEEETSSSTSTSDFDFDF